MNKCDKCDYKPSEITKCHSCRGQQIKELKERIEFAVDYLPECPDKALAFLTPVVKK